MSVLRALRVLIVCLLLCGVALVMPPAPAQRPVLQTPRPRRAMSEPESSSRWQARVIPPQIPNYADFAACAEQYSALWAITYEHHSPCPYTARNRVTGHTVAVDDLDLLDHILGTYEPPHPVRGYYGQQVCTRTPTRTLDGVAQ